MKSKYLNTVIEGNYIYKPIKLNNKFYRKSKEELKEEGIKEYSIKELIDIFNGSKLLNIFKEEMKDFNTNILYTSVTHGVFHNERTSFYTLLLCTLEGLNEIDTRIALNAAKYHDIGRVDDSEDDDHGRRSSEKIDFLETKFNKEEINILKTIIICHSIDDSLFESVALKNNIKDIKRCKKLLEVLKDSDALDRGRLNYPYISLKFMRISYSKQMILPAYEMYYHFKRIMKL